MHSERRSVLVVDDSPFIRRVVRDLVSDSPDFVVVGEAGDGAEAIEQVRALSPDVVTLDVEMPVLDGLQVLSHVMRESPRPVVMLSALETRAGADLTIRALELGAVDFVRKPARDDVIDIPTLRLRLLSALRAAAASRCRSAPIRRRNCAEHRTKEPSVGSATRVVVVAASTGGPRALAEVIPTLPASLDAAVVIVQHMPAGFTESLARRLDQLSALRVLEGRHGDRLETGTVYVAPGGWQTTIRRDLSGAPMLDVSDGSAVQGLRPAAEPLLQSAAAHFGADVVAVVLTGMGTDGAEGVASVRAAGGRAIVQDRGTSVVFGMPQAAIARAGADRIVPLGEIADAIVDALSSLGRPVRGPVPGTPASTRALPVTPGRSSGP